MLRGLKATIVNSVDRLVSVIELRFVRFHILRTITTTTRDVPKVMSNFFLHANWEQQTKESAMVDGTSCCVILGCLVTSIACIT